MRLLRKLALLVALLGAPAMPLGAKALTALDGTYRLGEFQVRSWQIENGLPQNSVQAVLQDRQGYLWLATQGGVARFDGVRFVVFDRSNTEAFQRENTLALAEDRDGTIWIGTDSGLLRYRRGEFVRLGLQDGLPGERVRALKIDQEGTLWAATSGGVCRLRNGVVLPGSTISELASVQVSRIRETSNGTLWFPSVNGLYRYANGRLERFGAEQGLSDDTVYDVRQDRAGALWVGTNRGLARLLDGRFFPADLGPAIGGDTVRALFEDSGGSLYLGLERRGLARVRDGRAEIYGKAEGFAGNFVVDFLEDRDGNLWLGTFDAGLACLRRTAFLGFGVREGLRTDDVQSIFQGRDKAIWVGTNGGGLSCIKAGKVRNYTTRDGLADDTVMALTEDREGVVWAGTPRGLSRVQDGRATTVAGTSDVLPGGVRALAWQGEVLWIGTGAGGLFAMKDSRVTAVKPPGAVVSGTVHAMLLDRRGRLWVGGPRGLTVLENGKAATYTKANGLGDDAVLSLYEDADGVLWIGTFGGGLSRLKDGRIVSVTMRDGLHDGAVFAILEDDEGVLWMSCNKGVFNVSKAEVEEFARGRLRRVRSIGYTQADGMRGSESNGGSTPAAWRTSDGRLWFAALRGAVILDPAHRTRAGKPRVALEEITYDRRGVKAFNELDLPPGDGELEFRYTGLDFRSPQGITFRYRLEGFDLEWHEALDRREAFYTNVPPGRYTFRVIARNKDGDWDYRGASLPIRIRPHYYQAWWFFALCGLAAAAASAAIYGMRVRGMKARERKLALLVDARTAELRTEISQREQAQARLEQEIVDREKVQEELAQAKERAESANQAKGMFLANMSHEIRTPMNGIIGMTGLLLETGLDERQREYAETVKGCSDSLLTLINDILDFSKIEAGKLDLETLDFDLRSTLEDVNDVLALRAHEKGLELACLVDPAVPSWVQGDPGRLRQVITNLVGNAVKFTAPRSVARIEIIPVQADNEIGLAVRDNGVGFDPADANRLFALFQRLHRPDEFEGSGLGLALVRRVVEKHGGRVWAEGQPGGGAIFYLTLASR